MIAGDPAAWTGLIVTRPRSPDYGQIKDGIVENAAALFAIRGYAATAIGDIADACGCSKSRLYHYFGSKEAILSFMLSEHVEALLSGGRALLAQDTDPVDLFRDLVRFYLEIYAVSRDKHVVLLTCLEFLPLEERDAIKLKERRMIAAVQDVLARIRPDEARSPVEANADAMLFFGMINWTYTWFKAEGATSPSDLADRCVALFMEGFRQGALPRLATRAKPEQTPRKRQPAAA